MENIYGRIEYRDGQFLAFNEFGLVGSFHTEENALRYLHDSAVVCRNYCEREDI